MIPDEVLDKHIAILGKTGSGKTNTAKVTVERLLDRSERVCIVDPTSAWWGLRVMADGKSPGYEVVVFGGKHGDLPLSGQHGATIADVIGKSSTPAILDTRLLTVSDRTRFFTDFAEGLIRSNQGPLTLVIDEAHLFIPQSGARAGGQAPAMLHAGNNLVSLGRGLGLRIILISQRPAKLHKDGLTQVETLVAMRLIAPQDRNAIKDWIIEWADPDEGKGLTSGLPSMPTGEAVVWSPELGLLEKMQFPLARTFDSSKAPTKAEVDKLVLAPIDVEKLEGKLKEAADEAKANDPRALKAEIARLTREMQAAQNIPADPKAIEEAEQRGYERGHDEGYKEGRNVGGRQAAHNQMLRVIEAVAGAAMLNGDADILNDAHGRAKQITIEEPSAPASRPAPKAQAPSPHPRQPAAPVTRAPAAVHDGNSGNLTPARQRILDALAWLATIQQMEPDKTVLAFIAGASSKSSAYANNLGAMRSAGLIDYAGGGRVFLTDAGNELARAPDAPLTHQAIMALVNQKVPPAQARILEAVSLIYPSLIEKGDLADQVGASATSSAFANNLGRLRSLGLLTYPRANCVRADDRLFP